MSDNNQRNIPLCLLGMAGLLVSALAGLGEHLPLIGSLCAAACGETAEITLFHAPVWLWGAVFWAAVAILALVKRQWAPRLAAPAFGIEAALVWIMFRMEAPCVFCIANAALVVTLLALSFNRKLFWQQLALALVFVLAGTAWIPYENGLFASTVAREQTRDTGAEVVARIGDENITEQRLEVLGGPRLFDLKKEIYRIKREKLDQLIVEYVLQKEAKEKGQAMEQFLDESFAPPKFNVTEQEIDKYLQENQGRVSQYQGPPGELRPRLKAFIEQQKRVQAINEYAHALGPKYGLQIFLPVPQPVKMSMNVAGAPSQGPPDAPVTIIEFSDYECPACRVTHETVKKVREAYGNRIRWIFMDYPLRRHKDAFKAAEAAHCAADQGKFWEYQELVFTRDKLDVESLVQYASELGLSADTFRRCLQEDKHKEEIEKSTLNAARSGVDRTPSFIINGALFVGGPAFENFKAKIDEELKKKD